MEVVIQYFDGCSGWAAAREAVAGAIRALHLDVEITLLKVESDEDALRVGFHGSPSILVDGQDLFPNEASPVGMSCRVYLVDEKRQDAPSVHQLIEALRPRALS
ncbi:MAG: hypothetical protein NVS1B3_03070 [Candidatus Dormibacteraceae bacterium]